MAVWSRSGAPAGALTRARLDASVQTDELRLLPYLRIEHGSIGTGATIDNSPG